MGLSKQLVSNDFLNIFLSGNVTQPPLTLIEVYLLNNFLHCDLPKILVCGLTDFLIRHDGSVLELSFLLSFFS